MDIINYIFNTAPGTNFKYYTPLLILSGILIIGAMLFSIYYKKKKKTDFAFKRLFKKTASRFIIMGILLLLLIAIRYENIPYFSMRIWLYLLLLTILLILIYYLKVFFIKYPKEKINQELNKKQVKKEENQYLPHKKKKKKKK